MNITDFTGYFLYVTSDLYAAATTAGQSVSISGIQFVAGTDPTTYTSLTIDRTGTPNTISYGETTVCSGSTWSNNKYQLIKFTGPSNVQALQDLLDSYLGPGNYLIAPSTIVRKGDMFVWHSSLSGLVKINGISVSDSCQLYHGDIIEFSRTTNYQCFKGTHQNEYRSNYNYYTTGWYNALNSSVDMFLSSLSSPTTAHEDSLFVIYRTDLINEVSDPYGYSWEGSLCPPLGGLASSGAVSISNLYNYTYFNYLNRQSIGIGNYSASYPAETLCSQTAHGITWENNNRQFTLLKNYVLTPFLNYSFEVYTLENWREYGSLSFSQATQFSTDILPAGNGVLTVKARNNSGVSSYSNSITLNQPQLPAPTIQAVNSGADNTAFGIFDASCSGGCFTINEGNETLNPVAYFSGWGTSSDLYKIISFSTGNSCYYSTRAWPNVGDWSTESIYTWDSNLPNIHIPNFGRCIEGRIAYTDGTSYYAIADNKNNILSTDPNNPTIITHFAWYLLHYVNDNVVSADTRYYYVIPPCVEIDIADLFLSPGYHHLYAINTGYRAISSSPTLIDSYSVYAYSPTIEHCTVTQLSPDPSTANADITNGVYDHVTYTLQFTSDTGYVMPENVTVNEMTSTWTISDGGLTGTLVMTPNFQNTTGTISPSIIAVPGAPAEEITIEGGGIGGGNEAALWENWDGTTNPETWMRNHTPDYTSDAQWFDSMTFTTSTGYWLIGLDEYGTYYDADDYYLTVTVESGNIVKVGNYNSAFQGTNGTISIDGQCMIEGTRVTLADGSTKNIEDITPEDELLVWDFYNSDFATAKPEWIMDRKVAKEYNLVTFDNGTQLGLVGGTVQGYHRIFNQERQSFTHTGVAETPNGTTTFADDGSHPKIVSQEIIHNAVNYYNIITKDHYNLFANGILTSCRLSNRYDIQDMKYTPKERMTDLEVEQYLAKLPAKKFKKVS
ncbi:MAG: hypothetical protein J6S67_23495 [Methanobrevibacter sp.]|nr:hypothetical protein [Methanobrevibacter sp.]